MDARNRFKFFNPLGANQNTPPDDPEILQRGPEKLIESMRSHRLRYLFTVRPNYRDLKNSIAEKGYAKDFTGNARQVLNTQKSAPSAEHDAS